jgi:hypothetical protein
MRLHAPVASISEKALFIEMATKWLRMDTRCEIVRGRCIQCNPASTAFGPRFEQDWTSRVTTYVEDLCALRRRRGSFCTDVSAS